MGEQLRYACLDIKRRPAAFVIFTVQMFAVLLLTALLTTTAVHASTYASHLERLSDAKGTYLLRNQTDVEEEARILDTPGISQKLYSFYTYLHTAVDFKAYSYYEYPAYLGEYQHLPALHVSEEFLEIFHLQVAQGSPLTHTAFQANEKTPILFGASFQKQYQIGDCLGERYTVAGFLEKGAFYLSPKATNAFLYLDEMAVIPIVFDRSSDYAQLHMAIEQTCVITQRPAVLQQICGQSEQLGLFDLHFESFASQLDSILNEAKQQARLELTICVLILAFCITNIVTELLHFNQSHRREFAIHLLCGATVGSLALRIGWQIVLPLAACQLLVTLVFHTWQVLVVLACVNAAVCAAALGVPVLRLLRQDVNAVFIRSE